MPLILATRVNLKSCVLRDWNYCNTMPLVGYFIKQHKFFIVVLIKKFKIRVTTDLVLCGKDSHLFSNSTAFWYIQWWNWWLSGWEPLSSRFRPYDLAALQRPSFWHYRTRVKFRYRNCLESKMQKSAYIYSPWPEGKDGGAHIAALCEAYLVLWLVTKAISRGWMTPYYFEEVKISFSPHLKQPCPLHF